MHIRILGWPGYTDLFKQLREVKPSEKDMTFWPRDEYSDNNYSSMTDVLTPAKNADDVFDRFHPSDFDFVIIDREYKEKYFLAELKRLHIYPDRILYSALPLLAARHYYTIPHNDKGSCLVPVRFGTNGVVCNKAAIGVFRDTGIIEKDGSCLEKFSLEKLYQKWKQENGTMREITYYRWGWNKPVEKIMGLASQQMSTEVANEFRAVMNDEIFQTTCDTWEDMSKKLCDSAPVVMLGPSEMLAAPINRDGERVDWFLVRGAGLLWFETIGCTDPVATTTGIKTKEVLDARRNWLVGVALRLMHDPWEAVREGEYWGYPVLGWSVCSSNSEKRKKAIEHIVQVAGARKAVGITRCQDPGEWMSNFLMEAGIALRD